MNYIKVRPLAGQPWLATVWRDRGAGPLSQHAEYLGRLTLHAERHIVCPRGEDGDTHWYTQLTKALTHLAKGKAEEGARQIAISRGHPAVGAAGYIEGRTANGDNWRAAVKDQADTRHAVANNVTESAA